MSIYWALSRGCRAPSAQRLTELRLAIQLRRDREFSFRKCVIRQDARMYAPRTLVIATLAAGRCVRDHLHAYSRLAAADGERSVIVNTAAPACLGSRLR